MGWSLKIPHSNIPVPGIPSGWLVLTVYFNTYVNHMAWCALNRKKTCGADKKRVVSVNRSLLKFWTIVSNISRLLMRLDLSKSCAAQPDL